jgi:DNA-binding FrmR family transcriptional regulator
MSEASMATSEHGAGEAGAAACGCGVDHGAEHGEGRTAVAVDAGVKDRNLKRLRRIEGQIRGLQRMVEEDRYCADILTQISSVHEALRSVGRELVRNHLKHCAAAAIRSEEPESAEKMYDELVDMMFKHVR